jgi:hypothetical protein
LLEDLVADELRPLVRRLILDVAREELAHFQNGHVGQDARIAVVAVRAAPGATKALGPGTDMATTREAATAKKCSRCGQTKASNAFQRGRRVCRSCRSQEQRQRERERSRRAPAASASDDDEEPGRSPAHATATTPLDPSQPD